MIVKIDNKLNIVSYNILLILILISFFGGFPERSFTELNKVYLGVFFICACCAAILFFIVNSSQIIKKWFFYLITISIIISLIYNALINRVHFFLLEFIILISFSVPLYLFHFITPKQKKSLLKLFLYGALVQLFFDVLLPDYSKSELDMFTGTFIFGNDKARFLLMVLGFLFLYKKELAKSLKINKYVVGLTIFFTFISFALGSSFFALLLGAGAFFFALVYRKIWFFFLVNLVLIYFLNDYMQGINKFKIETEFDGFVVYNYHRYFDEAHGVHAIYLFGLSLLKHWYNFLGIGLGSFISRSAQLFSSPEMQATPRTMITFGTIYEDSVAPPGVSAFFIFFIELGALALPIILYIIKKLKQFVSKTLYGFFGLFYILYLMNYSPMFFEFMQSFLFLSFYYLSNDFIKNDRETA